MIRSESITDQVQDSSPKLDPAPISAEWTWRSNRYAWWVVAVLGFSLTLSMADRMILALMIGPIKRDLHLGDTQVGLVQGLAFTILYVLAGFPLGRLADTRNRRALAAGSIVVWSLATGACAAAVSFATLFGARLVVGVGEAGLSPAAVSLISDYFPKEQRARPLTCLVIGTSCGAGLVFMVAGSIVQAIGQAGTVSIPLVGLLHGWQVVFIGLGVVGVLFSLAFLSIREPARRERAETSDATFAALGRLIWARRGFLATLIAATSATGIVYGAYSAWMPAMLTRRFGWGLGLTGLVYGGCVAIGVCTGILCAGSLVDWLIRRGVRKAAQRVSFWAALGAIIPMALGPLLPSSVLVVPSFLVGVGLLAVPPALAPVALQQVCPNEFRGQVFAIYLLIASIFGYAVGPLLTACMTDLVLHNEAQLNLSLGAMGALFLPVAAVLFGLSMRGDSTSLTRTGVAKRQLGRRRPR